ncbi:MAG: SDR family NAD(P)-dependent oxidoreductase [Solirubrobacteraceae bacterium]
MNLNGKRALLTGASGGIGHAIARRLAAGGVKLTLTGRRAEVLEPLAAQLDAEVLPADLADREQLDRLLAQCEEVDLLVANAALPGSGRLSTLSTLDIDRALDVNLRAPIVAARRLAPLMAARGGGHIVLISSISGKTSTPGTSIYNATKFGLRGFGLSLRAELRQQNVGVTTVFPGFISDAGMFADTKIELPPGLSTRTPDQVADAVVRGIEQNKGELDVAPVAIRLGAAIAGFAPETASRISRIGGAEKISMQFEERQSDKR